MYTPCSLETFTASRRLTDTHHRSRHRLSNDQIARQFWSGQLRYLKVSYWPIGDLRLKGSSPGLRTPMYPYVAPRTARIHTLITLGISIRTKWLVFWLRTHRPCGFDSHRPLHFSLSGVSPRCPLTQFGLSCSSGRLNSATVHLIDSNSESRKMNSIGLKRLLREGRRFPSSRAARLDRRN